MAGKGRRAMLSPGRGRVGSPSGRGRPARGRRGGAAPRSIFEMAGYGGKQEGFSPGGLAGNFLSEAQSMAAGLPRGLVESGRALWDLEKYAYTLGRDPIDEGTKNLGRGIAQSYKNTYGRGLRGLYENPLSVLLDAATVFTGGASLAAKAGATAAKTGRLTTMSGKVVEVERSRRAGRRLAQAGTQKALDRLPQETPGVGEYARAGRVEARVLQKPTRALRNELIPYDRIIRKLSKPERVAVVLRAMTGGDPDAVRWYAERSGLNVADDSEVFALIQNPSDKMLKTEPQMRHVAEQQRQALGLDPEVAEARTYLFLRLAGGAHFVADTSGYALSPAGDVVRHLRTQGGDFKTNKNGDFVVETIEPVGVKRVTESGRGFQRRSYSPDDLSPVDAAKLPDHVQGKLPRVLEGGPSVEDLKARVQRGEIAEPVYFPHQMGEDLGNLTGFGRSGGTGPTKPVSPMRQNRGMLAGRGLIELDPIMLSQSFLRAAKYGLYRAVHRNLVDVGGKRMTLSDAKAFMLGSKRGQYQLIRENLNDRVPHTVRGSEAHGDWLQSLGDDMRAVDSNEPILSVDDLTFRSVDEAAEAGAEHVIVVPSSYVKQVAGEFTRSNRFLYLANKYPLRVWRALVLNLRPAWLVNNIIGNTMLFLISQGPRGIMELKASFKRTWPENADDIEKVFRQKAPEQVHGSFIGTQRPTGITGPYGLPGLRGTVGRKLGDLAGALATFDKFYETSLRRAALRSEMKKQPRVREFVNGRKADSDMLAKAADNLTDTEWDGISRHINDGLGDFTHLSNVEKGTLRGLFPFYAWYRAITIVALKMPLERPLTTQVLARLGEIGAEMNVADRDADMEDVLPYLRGFIPTGKDGGRWRGYSTAATSPYGTVAQVAEAASMTPQALQALLLGRPGEGVDSLYDVARPLGLTPFIGGGAAQVPQIRLAKAFLGGGPTGNTLQDRDAYDELLRYLGVPYSRISPSVERRLARK